MLITSNPKSNRSLFLAHVLVLCGSAGGSAVISILTWGPRVVVLPVALVELEEGGEAPSGS